MRFVFDLDGCLIDSRGLIIQAYHDAGVLAPDNVLECEGVNWLERDRGYDPAEARILKAEKNAHYLRRLAHFHGVAALPPYDVARRLVSEGRTCYVYTGAPTGTIDILREKLSHWPFQFAFDGVTTPMRMHILSLFCDGGVYIDDQSRLVDLPNDWRFVQYVRQNADELYREIMHDVLHDVLRPPWQTSRRRKM